MSKVLVIIPAYNEEDNIRYLKKIINKYKQYDFILINDGSTDSTAEVCREAGINFIDLPFNIGLAGAVQTGLIYAFENDYDYALQFDGDGQHRPEYIAQMLEAIKDGYDIIIGSRFINERKKFKLRMIGSSLIALMIFLTTGTKITDPTSGMRLFNKNMISIFAHNINFDPEPDTIALLLRKNFKISECPVKMDERKNGKSFFSIKNSILYITRMILSICIIQWSRKVM